MAKRFGPKNPKKVKKLEKAYFKLIDALLTCRNGQEIKILMANQHLIDADLVKMMGEVATMRVEEGDRESAGFLINLAAKLTDALGLQRHTDRRAGNSGKVSSTANSEDIGHFFAEVRMAMTMSNANPDAAHPILQTYIARDRHFIQRLRSWVTAQIAEADPEKAVDLAAILTIFGSVILDYRLGDRAQNVEEAIFWSKTALKVINRDSHPEIWAAAHITLGGAYSKRSLDNRAENLKLAIACYTNASYHFTREHFPKEWAENQGNLGTVYRQCIRGDRNDNFNLAIACYDNALQILTRDNYPEDWARIQHQLGILNTEIGSYTGEAKYILFAIDSHRQALYVRTRDKYPEQWARSQANLSSLYQLCYQLTEKIEYLELAINYSMLASQKFTRDRFPYDWAHIQYQLGFSYMYYFQQNQLEYIEKSIKYYNNCLLVYNQNSYPEQWARSQNGLGCAYQKRIHGNAASNLKQAFKHWESAWQVFTPTAFPEQCFTTSKNFGNAAFNIELWTQAIEGYAKAIEAVEQIRTWSTSESNRYAILALAVNNGIYQNMVQACIYNGKINKALEYVERSKSKRLADLIASNDLYSGGEISPEVKELLQRFDNLQQQIDRKRSQNDSGNNRELIGVGTDTLSRAALKARNDTITALETQKQQVWEQIRRLDPVLAGEIKVDSPNFAAMQKLIEQPTTAILSFYTTGDHTYIFILRQNQITLHCCSEQGQKILPPWIAKNWLFPYVEKTEREANWNNRMSPVLAELSDRLQLNNLIAQHLDGIDELILVPHLLLHLIPFAALPIQDSQYRYLGDKFLIRYAPSCQVLEFCKNRGEVEGHLTYGTVEDATDDLPCAGFEGEQIAQLFNIPEIQRLRGRSQATRENYRQLAEKVQLLHSCHHAESCLDNPLESVLKLGDGNITLGQLMTPGWRLPNLSDVFLSCCETGLGLPALTDDIFTLSTGFLCAGARSVVNTLWSVDDLATALFSIFYYQQRKQGKSRPEALQQAQIKLRKLKKEDLKEELKEISELAEARQKEAIIKRRQYPKDSAERLQWDREYSKYDKLTKQIDDVKNSSEEFPFAHPIFWAGFTCSGLR